MTPRLHLPGPLRPEADVTLGREPSHYLMRVLRLRVGDVLEVFDGAGARHAATLLGSESHRCRLRIGAALPSNTESPLRITLAQCISSSEKMDWAIEKAVELGVAQIVPLTSERAVVRLDAARAQRRSEHWKRLIVAACMQCGRDHLPELHAVQPLSVWLTRTPDASLRLILAPGACEALGGLATPAGDPSAVELLVGPEAGFSHQELARASAAGWRPVGLGPRVLRTETAGLVALAILQARFGDLGPQGLASE